MSESAIVLPLALPKWPAYVDRHLLFQTLWRKSQRASASTDARFSLVMGRKGVSLEEGVGGLGIATVPPWASRGTPERLCARVLVLTSHMSSASLSEGITWRTVCMVVSEQLALLVCDTRVAWGE